MAAMLSLPGPGVASPSDRIGETLQDVTLKDLKGQPVKLDDLQGESVLVIAYTGVGCPIANRYAPRLEALHKKFAAKGVAFVGINANPQDDDDAVSKAVAELGLTFPVLKDDKQELTKLLDAKTSTEAFVVDKARTIRYRGQIDDQYTVGAEKLSPKNKYLEKAIQAVIKGKAPEVARTAAPGCLITRVQPPAEDTKVTYSSHVAAIVQENCQNCHRPKQIGPFPLTTYEAVSGWSAMIYSVLEQNRMPPWNADAAFDGHFVNQRKLAADDKKLLMDWIRDGMPRGNPDEDPPPKKWAKDWRIGKPDKVYSMSSTYNVPAEGVVEYKYFTVRTDNATDKWIQAMEARPGAEEVVHHILVFIKDPKSPELITSRIGLEDGFLCATVPGDTPSIFPEGYAKRLPAKATLVFQIHYTPNGKAQQDKCSIGMVFADGLPEREVRTRGIYNFDFEIPAGAENHEVNASYTLAEPMELLSFFPHMHTRGKDWTYVAHLPGGEQKKLLFVPRYDFNWQESYILKQPLPLPKDTKLECIAHYDNSAANFRNPDPSVAVKFGEQTWEEMMIGYIDYVVALNTQQPAETSGTGGN
jgi:peroxiredoxin